jgi:hypothetical protein
MKRQNFKGEHRGRTTTLVIEDMEKRFTHRMAQGVVLSSRHRFRLKQMTEFWATLTGAAVGVVAGAIIQYIAQIFIDRSKQSRQRQALKKEMQYNLAVVSDLSDECRRLRDAVNGDVLKTYFGYFNYERGIFSQSNALLNDGLVPLASD